MSSGPYNPFPSPASYQSASGPYQNRLDPSDPMSPEHGSWLEQQKKEKAKQNAKTIDTPEDTKPTV